MRSVIPVIDEIDNWPGNWTWNPREYGKGGFGAVGAWGGKAIEK